MQKIQSQMDAYEVAKQIVERIEIGEERGHHMSLQITDCPTETVHDLESLMHAISDGKHDIDVSDFEQRLGLGENWDWEDVLCQVENGSLSAQQVDDAIHRGLR